jgi:hypothetical protein
MHSECSLVSDLSITAAARNIRTFEITHTTPVLCRMALGPLSWWPCPARSKPRVYEEDGTLAAAARREDAYLYFYVFALWPIPNAKLFTKIQSCFNVMNRKTLTQSCLASLSHNAALLNLTKPPPTRCSNYSCDIDRHAAGQYARNKIFTKRRSSSIIMPSSIGFSCYVRCTLHLPCVLCGSMLVAA